MIICPLCHKNVRNMLNYEIGQSPFMADEDDGDFECPTYVLITEGHRWSHYSRITHRTTLKERVSVYHLLAPPFEIMLFPDGKLEVDEMHPELNIHGSLFTRPSIVLQIPDGATFQDFLNYYERFKKLVVFS